MRALRKNEARISCLLFWFLVTVSGLETVAAVHWPITGRLERHLGFSAAVSADSGIHLALRAAAALLFAALTARQATARLVGKALFSEEFLLTGSKNKFSATVTASQGFVLEHLMASLKKQVVYLLVSADILFEAIVPDSTSRTWSNRNYLNFQQ